MVLNYFGPDVNQNILTDVMRTTPEQGTLSLDIVRGAQFSILSSSVGKTSPNGTVINGYPGRSLGYGAFSFDSQVPWLDEIKTLVSQNYPVIVLMSFEVNDTDGHFRVVVGYDDSKQEITMMDPWDRGYPRVAVWPYTEFLACWNYLEPFSPRLNPYFGVAVFPLSIVISGSKATMMKGSAKMKIEATVSYPCIAPFNCKQFPANNVILSLQLLNPVTPYDVEIQSDQMAIVGELNAGESKSFTWSISCNKSCGGQSVSVSAQGFIQGSLPLAYVSNSEFYPSYSYVDVIGTSTTMML